MIPQVIITPVKKGEVCFCGDTIHGQWSQYDKDLHQNICPECGTRILLMTAWLSAAGIRKCIQPSTLHGAPEHE